MPSRRSAGQTYAERPVHRSSLAISVFLRESSSPVSVRHRSCGALSLEGVSQMVYIYLRGS